VPGLVRESKDTAQDGARDPELKRRLADRVRDRWGKLLVVGGCALLVGGCFTRTIYVPHGEPVRLRDTIERAPVWVLDEDGEPVAGEMDLPEGWYALPDPGPRPSD